MKRYFKPRKKNKYKTIKTIFILLIIYISYSTVYHTLFEIYISKNTNEQIIKDIISNLSSTEDSSRLLPNYNDPSYILSHTLNIKIPLQTKDVIYEKEDIIESKYNIYIYQSHDSETYNDDTYNDYNIIPSVKTVSYILKEYLTDFNINTIVEEQSPIEYLKRNNLSYKYSYEASRSIIENNIKNNNYNLIIDIHRDSSPKDKTYMEYNNTPYAKVLFVIGTEHPTYETNLSLAYKLNNIINEEIPNISRGITKKSGPGVNGIYNQDLSPNILLIEVGGVENTIEELNNTSYILSKSILKLLEGE